MKKLLVSIFILSSMSAFAVSCPKEITTEQIAKMMVDRELSGARIESNENSPCLTEKNFPYVILRDAPSNEEGSFIKYRVDKEDLKILKITKISDYTASYQIDYQVNVVENDKKKVVNDSLSILINEGEHNRGKYGCAGVLSHPDNYIVYKHCITKEME
jgi:hypothetical protein